MTSFATVERFKVLHPDQDDLGDERIQALIDSVSNAIGVLCDVESIDAGVLELVTCNVVARSLVATDAMGVQAESWGASPYSGSVTYANPAGDIYLTAFEKKLLGIDGAPMDAAFVNPIPEGWSDV